MEDVEESEGLSEEGELGERSEGGLLLSSSLADWVSLGMEEVESCESRDWASVSRM